jgi:hypothetical protein
LLKKVGVAEESLTKLTNPTLTMDAAEVAELNNNMELLRTGNFADCTFIVGSDKKVIRFTKFIEIAAILKKKELSIF